MARSNLSTRAETDLAEALSQFYADPYGFVMFAYPWGEPLMPDGSANPLREKKGPEPWQKRLLIAIGEHVKENLALTALDLDLMIWRSAVASGHGIGKSTIVAWLIQWLMSTRPDTRGVVTANTQRQLEDKTWPELAKWHQLLICRHWFEWTATSYYFKQYPDDKRKNYMVTAMTVSETNTEAFAGLHNEGKTVFVLFDEASGIHSKVFEVAQGAMTDGEAFFFAFGNPSRPDGPFADCFDKHADMYHTMHVDSREVSHTNKQQINDIIKMYGADSDEARVRVYGQFPDQAYNGFISPEAVREAQERELFYDPGAALIMAVDVARFGRDETVIAYRQGRDGRQKRMMTFKGLNTVKVAEIVMTEANRTRPDVIVIESTGPGVGVIDMLRSRGYKVVEVHPGAPSKRPEHYFNKRAELWSLARDWIIAEGCLSNDPILFEQLTKILYSLDRHEQRTKIEPKEEYKLRTGLGSPDRADALILTFGVTLARRDANLTRVVNLARTETISDYDPIDY